MVSHMSYIYIWVNQQSAFLVSEQIDDISLMFFFFNCPLFCFADVSNTSVQDMTLFRSILGCSVPPLGKPSQA
jgi:uncharacterized membrane-anchored protein YitT (DUF2179 family)